MRDEYDYTRVKNKDLLSQQVVFCKVWTVVYNYDVIQPNITYQNFTDTKVSLSISGITGNNRSQNSKVRTGQFGVTENDNNYLTSTMAIWDSKKYKAFYTHVIFPGRGR